MERKTCQKLGSNRRGQHKKAPNKTRKQITQIIEKAQTSPLNNHDMNEALCGTPYFLGVFSSDQILRLKFKNFPLSFIVNFEPSCSLGSHWISFWISKEKIEIFDSLGFDPAAWNYFPREILQFLSRFQNSHKFKISPTYQSLNSHYCGLFCVYFICSRPKWSFKKCCTRIYSSSYTRSFRKVCHFLSK